MTSHAAVAPPLTLSDGRSIPPVGLGTWPLDAEEAFIAVRDGLAMGYRLIDTAAIYGNEHGVGRAIATSDVPREEIVVSTKLRGADHGYESALAGFEKSRARLGLEYIDQFLVHWPIPTQDRYVQTWRAFIRLREDGHVRSIGVSNFTVAQIERLVRETGVWPALNQVELHPTFAQTTLRTWDADHGIVTEAWRPLGGRGSALRDPRIMQLAQVHGRTPAQIVLRWHIQGHDVPLARSFNAGRLAEDIDVFDFALSEEEMSMVGGLDANQRLGGDPDHHVEL